MAGFGNIAGVPAASDLADMIRAVDYVIAQLSAMPPCDKKPSTWQPMFNALTKGYAGIRQTFTAWIATVPDALQTATPADAPQTLTGDLTAADRWGTMTRLMSAFIDLDRQLRAAGCAAPTYPAMPQPTRPDLDLELYNWSGQVLKKLGTAADWLTNPWVWAGAAAAALGLFYVVEVRPIVRTVSGAREARRLVGWKQDLARQREARRR